MLVALVPVESGSPYLNNVIAIPNLFHLACSGAGSSHGTTCQDPQESGIEAPCFNDGHE